MQGIYLVLFLLSMPVLWVVVDYPYLLKSVRMAWRSGRLGPAIDEFESFCNATVVATSAKSWTRDPQYNQIMLSDASLRVQEKLRTTSFVVIRQGKILYETY
ncbi:MAG: hypothetical protein OEQ53_10515, partial [Saprospiraceae bacterium]|nr:hypothetical protein [Saprospiraceae bacterium]